MLTDNATIHVCEYLDYRDWRCELVFPGEENAQRWVLRNGDGLITDQALLFCPCCGRDFRADCWWQIPGRPQENQILATARQVGEVGPEIRKMAARGVPVEQIVERIRREVT